MTLPVPRVASFALAITVVPLLLTAGCGNTLAAGVSVQDWCVRLETALRDRDAACECGVEPPSDEDIAARCGALDASSLDEAIGLGEVGWNAALASAIVTRVAACDGRPVTELLADDPVIGAVGPGEPCRVFADAARHPDDCAYGLHCVAPPDGEPARCVEVVSSGERCDDAHACERDHRCGSDGLCAASLPAREGGAGTPCAGESECQSGLCIDSACVGPFPLGASCEHDPAWGLGACDVSLPACPGGCTVAGACVVLCADGACRDGTCVVPGCASPS
ncbi:MAG: hypothetical protein M3Y87_13605 [Myxococcota bacterium]|nr:hypothetical protein [Myxococcota bacterium]